MKLTTKDVLKWAREAGGTEMQPYDYGAKPDRFIMRHEVLEHFAALAYAAGAAAERERCIADCESVDVIGADECIAAIRAREEKND